MTGRILVIGDVMTDIIAKHSGALRLGTDTPAEIRQMPGGSGANQALWLSYLGAPVALVARVGADDAAVLSAHFRARGVEPHLGADPDYPTGTLICLVDGAGERTFLTDRGANAQLGTDELHLALLDGAAMLHVSAYSLFEAGPRSAVMALLAAAHSEGLAVSIDPASSGFLADAGPATFLEWISGADFIFPNEDEAKALSGRVDIEGQIDFLLGHFKNVVLKRGAEGAIWAARDKPAIVLPARVVDVVDTTGAGDAFAAGFLASWLNGLEREECVAAANLAGAGAVTHLGAQPIG